MSPSSKFIRIYESLPVEAQNDLLQKHLATLLDIVPKDKAKKVMSAATRLQTRYSDAPKLDLKGKKREIDSLLDELARDSKRAFVKERSRRDELLSESVDSLLDWMNDIWSSVYEFKANYAEGHRCLLFSAEVLDKINITRGGCKCSFMNLPVNLSIKQGNDKIIKTFALTGATISEALLWLWRDLFVSLLDTGGPSAKQRITEMLANIEHVMGWGALENLLYGGRKSDDDDEDEFEDFDDEEPCYDKKDADYDGDESESDDDERCPCRLHASHWSDGINAQRLELRNLVQEALLATFKLTPSLALYNSLLSISADADATSATLLSILAKVATSSSETLVAALDIYASENLSRKIVNLLDSHSFLLRPRDALTLQTAVSVLSFDPPHRSRSLQILEKELFDTVYSIRAALRSSFCHIEDDENKAEITEIVKLRHASSPRRERVERWVNAVVTPGTAPTHPMAFAALMMGLPMLPGLDDGDDGDPLGYLDMDPSDPDLDDLREEFRPKIKDRFEGWTDTAVSMKGGSTVLLKVYAKVLELMPFLSAPDIVEEMIGHLADRPSKHHVCDALDTISSFCKTQRKKHTYRQEKKRKLEKQASAPSTSRFSFTSPPTSGAGPVHIPGLGGMEDVD